jgi:uncharacterized iron-regulated protein
MLARMASHRCPAPRAIAALFAVILACIGCASTIAMQPQIVLLGEQHDQNDHQRQAAAEVRRLAAAGRLGGVVLEMAERGHATGGLPAGASEAQARAALAWNDRAWPWERYGGIVMAAVAAGVPVYGGNLPSSAMREAMADAALDRAIDERARGILLHAVRDGHCGLLPEAQLPGMLRVQIARDRAMAQSLRDALAAAGGRQVLLYSGAEHAARDRGVPLHLQAGGLPGHSMRSIVYGQSDSAEAFDERRAAITTPRPDPCEALRKQLEAKPAR